MKFNSKLTAVAAGVGLATAGSAHATLNLGEFWATDQIGGVTYIYKQSELNDPTVTATPQLVDLTNLPDADGVLRNNSVRMHITGFSNHAGIDPASRAIQTYLGGWMEIWKSNGGPAAPTKIVSLQASTIDAYAGADGMGGVSVPGTAPDKGNTVHACGGNPQNDQIQCASIFNGDFSLFTADMTTDTYNRIGIWRTSDLPIDPGLDPALAAEVQADLNDMLTIDSNPNNICSQYSTDGNLLYIAAQTSPFTGGIIVVDVSNPTNPTILDAFNDVMAAGCGLVNHPDGKHLWITHGFNKQGDPEEISIWAYNRAGKKHGPTDRVSLPAKDREPVHIIPDPDNPGEFIEDPTGLKYQGDAHGMQFAGAKALFAWQTMRVDDTMIIVDAWANGKNGKKGKKVNKMNLRKKTGRKVVSPDVLDRSQLGTNMYYSTRGPRPTTAIGSTAGGANRYNNIKRKAGVDVFSTVLGYEGTFVKHESMAGTGGTVFLCKDPVGVTSAYPVQCDGTTADAKEVSASDPHGTKSLNYLSGF